jgi:hypothetical protein
MHVLQTVMLATTLVCARPPLPEELEGFPHRWLFDSPGAARLGVPPPLYLAPVVAPSLRPLPPMNLLSFSRPSSFPEPLRLPRTPRSDWPTRCKIYLNRTPRNQNKGIQGTIFEQGRTGTVVVLRCLSSSQLSGSFDVDDRARRRVVGLSDGGNQRRLYHSHLFLRLRAR